ncbi:MAG: LacI family DNA-binding transcriptional regulator, partial [Balneolales bacterium]
MPKKTTIYDVAKKANVAISTVSRVLNDSPYVS